MRYELFGKTVHAKFKVRDSDLDKLSLEGLLSIASNPKDYTKYFDKSYSSVQRSTKGYKRVAHKETPKQLFCAFDMEDIGFIPGQMITYKKETYTIEKVSFNPITKTTEIYIDYVVGDERDEPNEEELRELVYYATNVIKERANREDEVQKQEKQVGLPQSPREVIEKELDTLEYSWKLLYSVKPLELRQKVKHLKKWYW